MNERGLPVSATLRDAVQAIEKSVKRITVVISDEGKLLGTLTDGDIRRCLLSGGDLDTNVSIAMNTSPLTALVSSSDGFLFELLVRHNLRALPLVDRNGVYIRLAHIVDLNDAEEINTAAKSFNTAVIMAGGEGTRLRPLTEKIPKSMVEIGGLPLLERQVLRLSKAGTRNIYISVNYLSDVIENHFGDGSKFDVRIEYLRERKKLGTGGALSLLPEVPAGPILVINGDILTTSDFGHFYNFHVENQGLITIGAVNYRIEIPYGVIQSEGHVVTGLAEKPSQHFFCNAGIYAVSPEILSSLNYDCFINLTDIIDTCLENDRPIAVFPIHEYWTDIGTPADLKQAREEVKKFD